MRRISIVVPGVAVANLNGQRAIANAALSCALLAVCTLILFPPSRFNFYPHCPIHEYFGILCPGCGATRALSVLMRGHLLEAMRLNTLFVLLLPFVLFTAARTYLRAISMDEFRWPGISTPALTATLLAVTAFTIARNVPH